MFGSRRLRHRRRRAQAQQHRPPAPNALSWARALKPRSVLAAGTLACSRATDNLYELVSEHAGVVSVRRVHDGRHLQIAAATWRGPLFDLTTRPIAGGDAPDPRRRRAPIAHYYVAPWTVHPAPLTVACAGFRDPLAGELCECGRPAEHPVHLVARQTLNPTAA